jgi:hypothetical protein
VYGGTHGIGRLRQDFMYFWVQNYYHGSHLFSERPSFAEMRALTGSIASAGKNKIILSTNIPEAVQYSWRYNIELDFLFVGKI